mmetsp:Transcript_12930/g.40337  ORF Transcript_12930/g.40337 Transcript_12930/m.40337 type:complete len:211 (-) Transcript_12930:598-1230(-)
MRRRRHEAHLARGEGGQLRSVLRAEGGQGTLVARRHRSPQVVEPGPSAEDDAAQPGGLQRAQGQPEHRRRRGPPGNGRAPADRHGRRAGRQEGLQLCQRAALLELRGPRVLLQEPLVGSPELRNGRQLLVVEEPADGEEGGPRWLRAGDPLGLLEHLPREEDRDRGHRGTLLMANTRPTGLGATDERLGLHLDKRIVDPCTGPRVCKQPI